MTVYWSLFLLPVMFTLISIKVDRNIKNLLWYCYGVLIFFLVCYRYEVGGDWSNYLTNYKHYFSKPISVVFKGGSRDYGSEAIQWLSLNYLGSSLLSNLICGTIFIFGLLRLCKSTTMPILANVISIPYLVIVVGMGYTKQSAAIGLFMWAIYSLRQGKEMRYYFYIIIGALFHKTLIVMLLFGYLYSYKSSLKYLIKNLIILSFIVFIFYWFLEGRFAHYIKHFITDQHAKSSGAFIRLLLNIFCTSLFIIFYRRWKLRYQDTRLIMLFIIGSVLLFIFSINYSTFADRMALYILPMQIIILANIPILIYSTTLRTIYVLFIITLYMTLLFVWLNFAVHSIMWVPYKNYLFSITTPIL